MPSQEELHAAFWSDYNENCRKSRPPPAEGHFPALKKLFRKVLKEQQKKSDSRVLLGYGLFCGVYWGKAAEAKWQFNRQIYATQKSCDEESRTDHCLSREVRRIYGDTMLNIGNPDGPVWIRADLWLRENPRAFYP